MPVELRPSDRPGELDEIVAEKVDIHIEQMNNGYFWMSLTEEDGTEWHVHFNSRGRITVKAEKC